VSSRILWPRGDGPRPDGDRRRHPRLRGRPLQHRDLLTRHQGHRGGGPAAGAVPPRQHSGAFHFCLWMVTLTEAWAWNRAADEFCGPLVREPLGRRRASAQPRRQTPGLATGIAGERNSDPSADPAQRRRNRTTRRTAAELGGLEWRELRKVQESTEPIKTRDLSSSLMSSTISIAVFAFSCCARYR